MSQKEKYRWGPAWILTATNITDPLDQWYNLGYTRGNVTLTVLDGKLLQNYVDQIGRVPLAEALWKHPDAFEIGMPLLEKQIDTLLKVAPGSVKLSNNSEDALGFSNNVKKISGRAFAIVPTDQFTEGDAWWDAEDAVWMFKGIANVDSQIDTYKIKAEDDLSPYNVTVSHLDDGSARGGIGPVWLDGANVLGFNVADEMSKRVTDSDTETALNNAGFNTLRDLVANTGSIDLSAQSLTDLSGLKYAYNSSGIDVSGNNVSQDKMSDFIDRLWERRYALGNANCVINISTNNGVDADAQAKIDGTGQYLYAIQAVDQTNKTITVAGDQRGKLYPGGRKFSVEGSTGNDGTYTVDGDRRVEFDINNNQTVVPVNESIPDATADGSVNDGLIGAGCTVTT